MARRRTIREQLIREIKDAGMSQKAFCEKAAIDPAQLSRLFSGKRDVSLATLDRLCRFLKLELRKIEDQPNQQ